MYRFCFAFFLRSCSRTRQHCLPFVMSKFQTYTNSHWLSCAVLNLPKKFAYNSHVAFTRLKFTCFLYLTPKSTQNSLSPRNALEITQNSQLEQQVTISDGWTVGHTFVFFVCLFFFIVPRTVNVEYKKRVSTSLLFS